MKIKLLVLSLLLVLLTSCTGEAQARLQKDRESGINGLNRTLQVYSYDGKLIKTYESKFDIETSEGGKVKFDIDGKRTIIYNAIVVCDEK